ncbi:hypothetical protein J3F83DRAFT_196109 [Trichoderma novae-zelandiae]
MLAARNSWQGLSCFLRLSPSSLAWREPARREVDAEVPYRRKPLDYRTEEPLVIVTKVSIYSVFLASMSTWPWSVKACKIPWPCPLPIKHVQNQSPGRTDISAPLPLIKTRQHVSWTPPVLCLSLPHALSCIHSPPDCSSEHARSPRLSDSVSISVSLQATADETGRRKTVQEDIKKGVQHPISGLVASWNFQRRTLKSPIRGAPRLESVSPVPQLILFP